MDRPFLNRVDTACDQALARYGFSSSRRGNPLLPIGDDFYGWVGLNQVNGRDRLQLNPFVGVHCIPMMKTWYSLDDLGKKYSGFRTATAAIHLGELAPDVQIFVFDDISNVDKEASRLALALNLATS